MRTRKQFPAPPPQVEPSELQAAKAIAAAINQGLPGDQFCRLMNVMQSDPVKTAAGMTVEQLQAWFMQNEAARYVLQTVPAFPGFCAKFLQAAKELYPNAPLFVENGQ
jgi:hypothetical protein